MPATQKLTARRNVTWNPTLVYSYGGAALPLQGAVISMQIRLYPGAADPALLAIPSIAFDDALESGTEGQDDEIRALTLSPLLTPVQIASLPGLNQPEAGDPQTFAFDIRIAYADGVSEVLSEGSFTVQPGVTTI